MDIPEETSELVKIFLSHFNKYKSDPLSKKNEKQLNLFLSNLYNAINNAFTKVELMDKSCFVAKQIQIKSSSDRIIPDSYNSSIFPQRIRNYIEKHETDYDIYQCTIDGRDIRLIFANGGSAKTNGLNGYVRMIYAWLTLCGTYSSKTCAKSLTIYIYNTPFNKSLPDNKMTTLSSEHVNTAYTSSCVPEGEIVIFRNEEWFKVLIHETFHTFGLDFSGDSNTIKIINDGIKKLFPIKSEINSYEAYTETWARILNCCFYSYNALENKKDKNQFIINSTFCLELERMFTLYQCNKVLRFMGLQYTDICNSGEKYSSLRKNLYKENTNVFAYYVVSAIFMNNYFEFLNWCGGTPPWSNNSDGGRGKSARGNFDRSPPIAFIDYISRHYKCDELLEGLKNMEHLYTKIIKKHGHFTHINTTTRMTLFG